MSELLKINVNEHVEKKNNLSYLSWAWAWTQVLMIDPKARWHAVEYSNERGCALPAMFLPDGSAMVKVECTIKGETKTCLLPVMNHRNQAIKNPDAFAINTAIMRCLAKAISMHGLGLYIYAGEDLPEGEEEAKPAEPLKPIKHKPTDGLIVSDDEKPYLQDLAMELIDTIKNRRDLVAGMSRLHQEQLEADQKAFLWSLLPSDVRSQIKTAQQVPV